jgi:peptide/nickel transport system ATP-binding protein
MAGNALEVKDLSTHIHLSRAVVQAVGNVDVSIATGETVGLVGESGCGKSMFGLSVLGLLPPGGRIVGGSIKVEDRELVGLPERELRRIRGNDVAMIFQDSQSSLNPTKSLADQIVEPIRLHRGSSRKEALDRAFEVLELVGLPHPRERLSDFPHQLSGGLRQRVMIAIALACEPRVLLADEPTGQLDPHSRDLVIQALHDARELSGATVIVVTHERAVSEALPRSLAIENGAIGAEGRGAKRNAVVSGSGTIQLPPEALARYPSGTLLAVHLDARGVVLRPREDDPEEAGDA